MDRGTKLQQLAAVLHLVADGARQIAVGTNGASREIALATQIEGIALELVALAKAEAANGPVP